MENLRSANKTKGKLFLSGMSFATNVKLTAIPEEKAVSCSFMNTLKFLSVTTLCPYSIESRKMHCFKKPNFIILPYRAAPYKYFPMEENVPLPPLPWQSPVVTLWPNNNGFFLA